MWSRCSPVVIIWGPARRPGGPHLDRIDEPPALPLNQGKLTCKDAVGARCDLKGALFPNFGSDLGGLFLAPEGGRVEIFLGILYSSDVVSCGSECHANTKREFPPFAELPCLLL